MSDLYECPKCRRRFGVCYDARSSAYICTTLNCNYSTPGNEPPPGAPRIESPEQRIDRLEKEVESLTQQLDSLRDYVYSRCAVRSDSDY